MVGGFIFGGSTGQTADDLKRQREMAQQAQKAGSSTAPVSGAVEAVARMLEGGLGGYFERQADFAGLPQNVKDAAKAVPNFDGFAQTGAAPYAGPNAPAVPNAPFSLGNFGFFKRR